MNSIRKIIPITALVAAFCASNIIHAWGNCCYVLYDKESCHIVRLLGDRHANYVETGKETETEHEFIKNVRIPLETYLQQKNAPEIFIVESGTSRPENLKNNVFWADDLMTHLVAFGYGIDHDTCGILKKPRIPIVSFDFRGYFGLNGFLHNILFDESPLDSLKKRKEARKYWNSFLSTFAEKHEMYTHKYDTTIKKALDDYAQKICEELPKIENFFVTAIDKAGLNTVRYFKKKYRFFKDKDEFLKLVHNFQAISIADYGFMSCIGKARAVKRNITLYTGSSHTENMVKELEKIGYTKLLFKEKENDGETPLSKEDCEKFFTMKPKEKTLQKQILSKL